MKLGRALRRTLHSLASPRVFILLFAPFFLALILWLLIFFIFWQTWLSGLTGYLQSTWILHWLQAMLSWQSESALGWVSGLFLILLFLPLTYLTSVLLTSALLMPILVNQVMRQDYSDLVKKRGGSFSGSLWNSLMATAIYLVLFVLTLPLWLFPGMAFIVPAVLNAWLGKRIFVYDSLQDFATPEERRFFEHKERGPLFGLGLLLSLLSYVPLLSFLLPVISGVAYAHFCLEGLRESRQSASSLK